MVASTVCLEATNVRQFGRNQMAVNFAVSPRLLKEAQVAEMDPISAVPNGRRIAEVSPGTAALRKINEVLAAPTSASNSPALSGPPTKSPASSDGGAGGTIQQAEQFKQQLMQAVNNNKFDDVAKLIEEMESAHFSKEALEVSRIGAVVNTLRKTIAESHSDLARKCRALIKLWLSNVDAARPTSSCGSSSANGTPSLISPALRRGITPRGKAVTPTAHGALNGYAASSSYAPSTVSPQMSAVKRKAAGGSPDVVLAKKSKTSPSSSVSPPAPSANSVIAARRNVQSTEQLVAALGMDSLFPANHKPAEQTAPSNGVNKVTPIQVPTIDPNPTNGRKKRQSKTPADVPPVAPRIKIVFGRRASGEVATKVEEVEPTTNGIPPAEAVPSTSSGSRRPAAPKKQPAAKKSPVFSWYDRLPSIEELEARTRRSEPVERPESPTDPMKFTLRDRTLILLPYLDSDEPEFVTYEMPDSTTPPVVPSPKA